MFWEVGGTIEARKCPHFHISVCPYDHTGETKFDRMPYSEYTQYFCQIPVGGRQDKEFSPSDYEFYDRI